MSISSTLSATFAPSLRRLPVSIASVLALGLCACPGGGEEGEGSEESEESGGAGEGACLSPGSDPGEDLAEFIVPAPEAAQGVECTSGWGSDAPMLAPTWTSRVGTSEEGFSITAMEAYPGGGAVVVTDGVFARVDGDGEVLWSKGEDFTSLGSVALYVEADGTILVGRWRYSDDDYSFDRYAADGAVIGPVDVPFNAPEARVWGIERLGEDLLIACDDIGGEGFYQPTFLRVNPEGEEVLRKGNASLFSRTFAVTEGGQMLFANMLMSADSGAVVGPFAMSQGGPTQAVASGEDFFVSGNSGDLLVGRYSAFGAERWLQAYDRVGNNDQGQAIAATAAGGAVVGGSVAVANPGVFSAWFSGQPQVLGTDADGNAEWMDRVAMLGSVGAIAVGEGGEVYAAGTAEGVTVGRLEWPVLEVWVRRYDP